jgi:protein-disulfide isomerase
MKKENSSDAVKSDISDNDGRLIIKDESGSDTSYTTIVAVSLAVMAQLVLVAVIVAPKILPYVGNVTPEALDFSYLESYLNGQGVSKNDMQILDEGPLGVPEVHIASQNKAYHLYDGGRKAIEGVSIDLYTQVNTTAKPESSALNPLDQIQPEPAQDKLRLESQIDKNLVAKQLAEPKNEEVIDKDKQAKDKKNTLSKLHANIIAKGDVWSIKYPAIGEEKDHVIVYTDTTCPFCKKFHASVPGINKLGVSVTYLFYPRALARGADDPMAKSVLGEMEKVWCSKDRKAALDDIFSGKAIKSTSCEGMTDRDDFPGVPHYVLGSMMNVTATPMTFTSDGRQIAGFRNIAKYLNDIKK